MKLLVCFTIEPDLDKLIGDDWLVENGLEIDTSFLKPVLNSYDESALEIALRLGDDAGKARLPASLSALTIGDTAAGPILRTLNAMPFDRVVRIDSGLDLRFRPMTVAAIVSQYIQNHASQDVLLLGQQTSIGENAKTHLLVAEMLGWPCITRVIQITRLDSDRLLVTSRAEGGRLRQQIKPPCVLSIGDAPNTCLRVPTLNDRMYLGKRSITVLPVETFDLPQETEVLNHLDIIRHRRSSIRVQGRNPGETARKLFDDHMKDILV